jgi:hypothetical protein
MHYILPTQQLAEELYHRSWAFTESRGLQPLSKRGSVEVIIGIIEEYVYGHLYWAKHDPHMEIALSQYLNWWVLGESLTSDYGTGPTCQAYYIDVLDPLELKLIQTVEGMIGLPNTSAMWMIWYTLRIGDDLVLERGEDFRIVEFERRFISGEWKL